MKIHSFLKTIAAGIDSCNERMGRFVSWIVVFLVAVVFIDVLMRYAANISFVFIQELEWHLFGFIFLMGAGYTLLYDQHVRVDIIYQKLSPKGRAWVNVLGCIVFLFPGALLIIYTSWDFAWESFVSMEGSPNPGGIPFRFIIKACIPLGYVMFLLQGLSMFIRNLNILIEPSDKVRKRII